MCNLSDLDVSLVRPLHLGGDPDEALLQLVLGRGVDHLLAHLADVGAPLEENNLVTLSARLGVGVLHVEYPIPAALVGELLDCTGETRKNVRPVVAAYKANVSWNLWGRGSLTELVVGGILGPLLEHLDLGHLVVHLIDDVLPVMLQFQVVERRDAVVRNSNSRSLRTNVASQHWVIRGEGLQRARWRCEFKFTGAALGDGRPAYLACPVWACSKAKPGANVLLFPCTSVRSLLCEGEAMSRIGKRRGQGAQSLALTLCAGQARPRRAHENSHPSQPLFRAPHLRQSPSSREEACPPGSPEPWRREASSDRTA